MKLFIDTNILFDYAFQESPHHGSAKSLIDQAPKLDHELFTSPYSYLTAFYSLRKHLGVEITARFLHQMSQRIHIRNALVEANLPHHFLKIANEKAGDAEDMFQKDIAVACKADAIITRDQQFIKQCRKEGMKAYLPDVFLAL